MICFANGSIPIFKLLLNKCFTVLSRYSLGKKMPECFCQNFDGVKLCMYSVVACLTLEHMEREGKGREGKGRKEQINSPVKFGHSVFHLTSLPPVPSLPLSLSCGDPFQIQIQIQI